VADKARNRALRSHKGQQLLRGEEYAAALRKKHALLNPNTAWARPKGVTSGTSDAGVVGDDAAEPSVEAVEKLLRTAGGLLASKGRGGLLGAGAVEVSRLRDANTAAPSDAVVKALQWHPNGQLVMTGGMDKKLRLFQVRGVWGVGGGRGEGVWKGSAGWSLAGRGQEWSREAGREGEERDEAVGAGGRDA
jgi:U3 small nucleolar RNA-associated protein 18